jgi:amino acid transporter
VLPLEITSATITINYWHSSVPKVVWVCLFWFLICAINMVGVKGYGEAEFIFSTVKVAAICGFIILGIVLDVGGSPTGNYIGAQYWSNPGAFHHGFKGLCSVFVTAAFSYSGTELVGLAAAETANPRKSIPSAVKQVFWRILLFYVISLLIIGFLIPYTDPRLLTTDSSAQNAASPFVIAITDAGIQVLPSVFNAVIMVAVLSVGNSSVYGSSRTLAALAQQGQAPKIFRYIDRRGRPLAGIAVSASLGGLAFLAVVQLEVEAFEWMMALSGLSAVVTWGSICLCHIRFRHAWKAAGRSTSELAFTAQSGLIGSYIGLIMNVLILVAAFWTSASPISDHPLSGSQTAVIFFQQYMALPILILFYLVFKFWKKTKWVPLRDIDIDSGTRNTTDLARILADEREIMKAWPRWKKVYKFFF